MKPRSRKSCALLSIACGLLLAAQSASAQEIYAKVGILGVGAGYAHSVNDRFGVRADFSTIGTISRNGTADRLRYDADLKANQLGAYGDWFPFGGSFRLSAGLHSRKLEVTADGRASQSGTISIGNVDVPYGGDADTAHARVKWPTVAPYLGIGWGHHASRGPGFGFIADIGVSFGSPKTELTISNPLRDKLEVVAAAQGTSAAAEIERQRRELEDDVEEVKLIPHLFLGVSYRF